MCPQEIKLICQDRQRVALSVEQVRVVHDSEYPEYEGETVVTPQVAAQTLETRNTVVTADIEVKGIPYSETTNLSGGYTAIIGE